MITIENFILITISSPLIVCVLTPFISNYTILRDCLGPIGGVISSWGAFNIISSALNNQNTTLEIVKIAEGVSIGFEITPLGAIFGLVASSLWIFAAIYSVGDMRGNKEKNQTRFYSFYAMAVHADLCIAYAGDLLTLFIFVSTSPVITFSLIILSNSFDLSKLC